MSPSVVANKGSNPTRVTRSQTTRRKQTFLFLALPAELRNMIYQQALNFEGLSVALPRMKAIDGPTRIPKQTTKGARKSGKVPHQKGSQITLRTPALLLVCRQITQEAHDVLYSQELAISTIPQGYPSEAIISSATLAKVRIMKITLIDLVSFNVLSNALKFIQAICDVVATSGKLEEMAIHISSQLVQNHLEQCVSNAYCMVWAEMEVCLRSLEKLRGLKVVRFDGIWVCNKMLKELVSSVRGLMMSAPAI